MALDSSTSSSRYLLKACTQVHFRTAAIETSLYQALSELPLGEQVPVSGNLSIHICGLQNTRKLDLKLSVFAATPLRPINPWSGSKVPNTWTLLHFSVTNLHVCRSLPIPVQDSFELLFLKILKNPVFQVLHVKRCCKSLAIRGVQGCSSIVQLKVKAPCLLIERAWLLVGRTNFKAW